MPRRPDVDLDRCRPVTFSFREIDLQSLSECERILNRGIAYGYGCGMLNRSEVNRLGVQLLHAVLHGDLHTLSPEMQGAVREAMERLIRRTREAAGESPAATAAPVIPRQPPRADGRDPEEYGRSVRIGYTRVRKARGRAPLWLAQSLNLQSAALREFEAGTRPLSERTLRRLAERLYVDFAEFEREVDADGHPVDGIVGLRAEYDRTPPPVERDPEEVRAEAEARAVARRKTGSASVWIPHPVPALPEREYPDVEADAGPAPFVPYGEGASEEVVRAALSFGGVAPPLASSPLRTFADDIPSDDDVVSDDDAALPDEPPPHLDAEPDTDAAPSSPSPRAREAAVSEPGDSAQDAAGANLVAAATAPAVMAAPVMAAELSPPPSVPASVLRTDSKGRFAGGGAPVDIDGESDAELVARARARTAELMARRRGGAATASAPARPEPLRRQRVEAAAVPAADAPTASPVDDDLPW